MAAGYLVSSVLLSGTVVWALLRRLGGFRADIRTFAAQWREGLLFAVSISAQNVYNDIDKTMLARLDTLGTRRHLRGGVPHPRLHVRADARRPAAASAVLPGPVRRGSARR